MPEAVEIALRAGFSLGRRTRFARSFQRMSEGANGSPEIIHVQPLNGDPEGTAPEAREWFAAREVRRKGKSVTSWTVCPVSHGLTLPEALGIAERLPPLLDGMSASVVSLQDLDAAIERLLTRSAVAGFTNRAG